jgi:hypothetical protein
VPYLSCSKWAAWFCTKRSSASCQQHSRRKIAMSAFSENVGANRTAKGGVAVSTAQGEHCADQRKPSRGACCQDHAAQPVKLQQRRALPNRSTGRPHAPLDGNEGSNFGCGRLRCAFRWGVACSDTAAITDNASIRENLFSCNRPDRSGETWGQPPSDEIDVAAQIV